MMKLIVYFYEVEDVPYNQNDSDDNSQSSESSNSTNGDNTAIGNFDLSNVRNSLLKYSIIQMHWKNFIWRIIHCDFRMP